MEVDILEKERYIDDDCHVVNHYYVGKRVYPNLPFYLQDENGDNFEFKWDLIYQYIGNINYYPDYEQESIKNST